MGNTPEDKPINVDDIKKCLDNADDFTFELKVLRRLAELGFKCRHGGTYMDPKTHKARQYDIRADIRTGQGRVLLAVECKRLTDVSPIVIHAVRRRKEEAFHMVGYMADHGNIPSVAKMEGSNSFYQIGKPTGKAISQITREKRTGFLKIIGDGTIYDKWSQAVSSIYDLVQIFNDNRAVSEPDKYPRTLVIPVLVVPDETLWSLLYGVDPPFEASSPLRINRCPYYIDHSIDWLNGRPAFRISHVEIVTLTGLADLKNLLKDFLDWQ